MGIKTAEAMRRAGAAVLIVLIVARLVAPIGRAFQLVAGHSSDPLAPRDLVVEEVRFKNGPNALTNADVELAGWTVDFADILALRADGSLLNKATVAKWGLRIGRIELVLRKRTA